jgi:hypothetical protein
MTTKQPTENIDYKITEKQCADNISGVCSQCGGTLEPLETVDNSGNPTFWSGCKKCCRFYNGVDPRVYEISKIMVDEYYFRPYSHIDYNNSDSDEIKESRRERQICGACNIVNQVIYLDKTIGNKK